MLIIAGLLTGIGFGSGIINPLAALDIHPEFIAGNALLFIGITAASLFFIYFLTKYISKKPENQKTARILLSVILTSGISAAIALTSGQYFDLVNNIMPIIFWASFGVIAFVFVPLYMKSMVNLGAQKELKEKGTKQKEHKSKFGQIIGTLNAIIANSVGMAFGGIAFVGSLMNHTANLNIIAHSSTWWILFSVFAIPGFLAAFTLTRKTIVKTFSTIQEDGLGKIFKDNPMLSTISLLFGGAFGIFNYYAAGDIYTTIFDGTTVSSIGAITFAAIVGILTVMASFSFAYSFLVIDEQTNTNTDVSETGAKTVVHMRKKTWEAIKNLRHAGPHQIAKAIGVLAASGIFSYTIYFGFEQIFQAPPIVNYLVGGLLSLTCFLVIAKLAIDGFKIVDQSFKSAQTSISSVFITTRSSDYRIVGQENPSLDTAAAPAAPT